MVSGRRDIKANIIFMKEIQQVFEYPHISSSEINNANSISGTGYFVTSMNELQLHVEVSLKELIFI